jgi:hypothetical protein
MRHFRELCLGDEVTPRLLTRDGVRYTLPQSRAVITPVNFLLSFEKEGQRFLLMRIEESSDFRS